MVNLNTCVEGQKLRLRNEELIKYVGRHHCRDSTYNHEAITENGKPYTYTDGGDYFMGGQDMRDVIEILPLETTDKHPSVAWWESCPWITDRKPTPLDGDVYGRVYVKLNKSRVLAANWSSIDAHEHWIHLYGWQPLEQTPREKALALITKHKDSSTVGIWVPTPEDWDIIREGLTE